MVEVSVKKIPVRMPPFSFFPNPWEGRDVFTTIYGGNVCSCDNEPVVGNLAPVHMERRAELV